MSVYSTQWYEHLHKRSDPGEAAYMPEQHGDWHYYTKEANFEKDKGEVKPVQYSVYMRHKTDAVQDQKQLEAEA